MVAVWTAGATWSVAEDIYVSQTASGADTGKDSANTHSLAWVNNPANWGSGAGIVGPGDTVHLVGTFTNGLTVGASGTAGAPITIYFEPDAKFSAPFWPSYWWGGGAITIQAKDYITVDGGSNGLIEATAVGTGYSNPPGSGVGAAACQHLTVQNLRIRNLYVRTSLTDETVSGGGPGVAVENDPTVAPYVSTYWTVSNCVISDCGIGIHVGYSAGCSNYTFIGNTISNVNWGIGGGDRDASASLDNVLVANNRIWSFAKWDDNAGNWYHHNGTYIWCGQSDTIRLRNVTYSGNIIGPGFGAWATSGMWVDGAATNVLMCNNLVLCDSNDAPGNAMLQITRGGKVLNNTFLGGGVGRAVSAGAAGWETTVMGNLVVATRAFENNYGVGSLVLDSNLVYAPSISQPYSFGSVGTGNFKTLAQVQAMGYELHTLTQDPLANSRGILATNSPAIGAGANYYRLFTTDIAGKPRPASGSWTIGAYEASTSGVGGGGGGGGLQLPPVVSAITQSGADVNTNTAGPQVFAGSVVQYSATASDPNSLPLTWQWSYSVNGGAETVVQTGAGTVGSVSFNYTADMAGSTFTWKLAVNNGTASATSTLTVGVVAPPSPTAGLSFQAADATVTAPFALSGGAVAQTVQTVDPTQGGQAAFSFYITNAGNYVIQALVSAPNDANNSFFVNVDGQPVDPTMIWDIPLTSGFEQRIVSWRGSGSDVNNEFVPAVFNLTAGAHQLIVRGREANVALQSVAILNYLSPPQNLRIIPQ